MTSAAIAWEGISVPRAQLVTLCQGCGSDRLAVALSLGSSPPPCVMHPAGRRPLTEEHFPLELLRCADCALVQLSCVVDPTVVFAPDYPYSSGNSGQLRDNFANLRAAVEGFLGGLYRDNLVVDVGANDGTLLREFAGRCRTVGVEPTDQCQRIDGPSYQSFFDESVADRIVAEHGQARVVTACNVMAHVPDPDAVMRGVRRLLAPGGVFVAENHDLLSVCAGQWDMVYHEHLRFYEPATFAALLARHDMGVGHWHPTDTHGGSHRVIANANDGRPYRAAVPGPADFDWAAYRGRVAAVRESIREELTGAPAYGVGATARGTTILNYCGLDAEDVPCVLEVPGSDKIGLMIPGTGIPVVHEHELKRAPRLLLLSWHLRDRIVPRFRRQGYERPILVPMPSPEYA